MSEQVVNIDEMLGKNVLKLVFMGETFIVKDIPIQVFMEITAKSENADIEKVRDLIREVVDMPDEIVKKIGMLSANMIFKAIMEWFSMKDKIGDKGEVGSTNVNP